MNENQNEQINPSAEPVIQPDERVDTAGDQAPLQEPSNESSAEAEISNSEQTDTHTQPQNSDDGYVEVTDPSVREQIQEEQAYTEKCTERDAPWNYQEPQDPATTYRWTYADQREHDKQNNRKNRSMGLLIYALVMTGVFAISFGLLLGVLFMKGDEFNGININEGITEENDVANREGIVAVVAAKHSVVVIEVTSASSSSSGTGIVLTQDGYIATNHHVIESAGNIRVRFFDGTYATAVVQGSSEVDDLAVIKVDRHGLVPATFAKSADCYVGETVYAIGNPGGPDFAWTTTKGIISYVDREVKMYHDDGTLEKKLKLLQTDAMVNPGNSGGPLVNSKGEVVGVVSMKLADGYEGIGFAIPSDGAVEILNAIIRDGNADSVNSNISYERPLIGITGVYVAANKYYVMEAERIVEVSENYAKENPEAVIAPKVSGIYVSALTDGMDAATKLQIGDIITAVNGVEATSMQTLMNEINEHYAGDEVTVTYYRGTIFSDITITLSAAAS